MNLADAWCPACRQWTTGDIGKPCAWCDTRLIRRRGGWKRPDAQARSRISRRQAQAIHAAHWQGRSLRDLARATWQTLGYTSDKSCLEGIRTAFQREGLRCRPQAEATSIANADRRERPAGETKQQYKRRRRREHGYRSPRTGEWRVAGQAPAEDGDSHREGKERSSS